MAQPMTYNMKCACPNITFGVVSFTTKGTGDPTDVWGRGSVVSVEKTATGRYTLTIPGTYTRAIATGSARVGGTNKDYQVRATSIAAASSGGNTNIFLVVTDGGTDSDLGGLAKIDIIWAGHAGGDNLTLSV